MAWEVSLHPEVEAWYPGLCKSDPETADLIEDAIDQLVDEGPTLRRPLADRLKGTGVTVNALHPGVVASNFNDGMRGLAHVIGALIYTLVGIPVEKGAQTPLYLATSPEVEGVSGRYFSDCKETPSSRRSYDATVRQRLWRVSEELIQQNELIHNHTK